MPLIVGFQLGVVRAHQGTALKMFIKCSQNGKLVYELSKELSGNPLRIQQTQRLSLDASRPSMGLSAEHGLFATKEWRQNIEDRRIPVSIYSGVIQRLYVAGGDSSQNT